MAARDLSIPFKIVNEGGFADLHQLRLVDAGEMYTGLHRTISYVGLSYLRGHLVERAYYSSELKIFQRNTTKGSLLHELNILISENAFLGGLAVGVLGNHITAAVNYCIRAAAGLVEDDEYGKLPNGTERIEPFFEDLIQKIEPHVAAIHAPIQGGETIDIILGDDEIELDRETKEYVSSSTISRRPKSYTGTVTRLNLVTGNGRFFCNELERIVSFSQRKEFRASEESKTLSWSLRQQDQEQPSEIEVAVREVTASSGRIKRLLIQGAVQKEDE